MGIPAGGRFAAISANGNTAVVQWPGGRGTFVAYGGFGGGTVKLQWSPDDGTTWLDVDRSGDTFVTFTVNGSGGFELSKCQLRCNTASATTPTVTAGVNVSKQLL